MGYRIANLSYRLCFIFWQALNKYFRAYFGVKNKRKNSFCNAFIYAVSVYFLNYANFINAIRIV